MDGLVAATLVLHLYIYTYGLALVAGELLLSNSNVKREKRGRREREREREKRIEGLSLLILNWRFVYTHNFPLSQEGGERDEMDLQGTGNKRKRKREKEVNQPRSSSYTTTLDRYTLLIHNIYIYWNHQQYIPLSLPLVSFLLITIHTYLLADSTIKLLSQRAAMPPPHLSPLESPSPYLHSHQDHPHQRCYSCAQQYYSFLNWVQN